MTCSHPPLLCWIINAFPLPAVDVRLGDPAHVGGQQPRGASAGVGSRVGAGLALPQWLRSRTCPGAADSEKFLREYNRRIVASSDEFYSYSTPSDFRLERREVQVFSTREVPDPKLEEKVRGTHADFLRFTSPVHTPYPENNLVNARWFPARGRRAVVLLPHWNSDAIAYTGLCRVLNLLGIAVLRLSMPYHDIRMPADTRRADYAVSANIGRTLDACRQAVIDVRCCLDWLEQQGYSRLGILGTSLGSCYAFLAAAHDPRIRVAAFNHASTYVADVVWHGQSTRHIREGLETQIDLDRLRALWSGISPISYFEQFARWPKKVAHHLCEVRSDLSARIFARCGGSNLSVTGWTTKSSCCRAATTPPAKRRTNTWMAGSWLRFCGRRSKVCKKASSFWLSSLEPASPSADLGLLTRELR